MEKYAEEYWIAKNIMNVTEYLLFWKIWSYKADNQSVDATYMSNSAANEEP